MENKFVLYPEETTLDFSMNLSNESFHQMRRELRFFGIRGSHCLKINLDKRLFSFIKENGDEKFFELCIAEIKKYTYAMNTKITRLKEQVSELQANPEASGKEIHFNAFEDFNECFNSIFRKAFLIPNEFDSILLVEPVNKTLKKFFRKRGYIFEITGERLFEQVSYFEVVIAKLIETREVTETLFGVKIKYNFQKVRSFEDIRIQGVPSFYNISRNLLRVDELSITMLSFPDKLLSHPEFDSFFSNHINIVNLSRESILLHEKIHVLFYKVLTDYYNIPPSAIFDFRYMIASEIFSRLVTLFISFSPLAFENYLIRELKDSQSSVYLHTYHFFEINTDILSRWEFGSLEEFIFYTRTKAFDGLLTWVNYMENNFNHDPKTGWLEICKQIEKAYNKVRNGSSAFKASYYPDLDSDDE